MRRLYLAFAEHWKRPVTEIEHLPFEVIAEHQAYLEIKNEQKHD